MSVHANTPPSDALAVQAVSTPPTMSLSSTSTCASSRSALVGATPARDSPPANVTVAALPTQVRLVMLSAVATHAASPVASPTAAQPALTVPGVQSVHADVLFTHAPSVARRVA
jgi:hypothetical protein